MRRFGRIVFNVVAAVSAVVFIVTATMGFAFIKQGIEPPIRISEHLYFYPCWMGVYLSNAPGIDPHFSQVHFSESIVPGTNSRFTVDPRQEPAIVLVLGRGQYTGTTWWAAYLSFADLARLTSVICVLWCIFCLGRKRRAAKRRAAGLCVLCGYDLRASNDQCPECGEPFGPAAKPEKPVHA